MGRQSASGSRSISAREAALNTLAAVERGRATLAAEIDLGRIDLADPRDRALFFEITTGTLRWQGRLDALLAQCTDRPIAELDAIVRLILRTAIYQLEFLDRVPAHAVIDEAVDLTRRAGVPKASGFVNGVLRAFQRTRKSLVLPAEPAEDDAREAWIDHLAVTLSHPRWLAARWLDRVGPTAARDWCRFNNTSPAVTIRWRAGQPLSHAELIDRLKSHEILAEPARFVADALSLAPGGLGRLPLDLRAGVIVQEEASQIVAHAVGALPGERVIDLCAAPGGKTMVIAEAMGAEGTLVASDFRKARVRLLRDLLSRAGVACPVLRLDALLPLPFGPVFDRVLLDVPCSGLGTARLNPDVKWTRVESDLAGFGGAQLTMLTQAAEVVKPGGRLVYATCSSEPEENEQVVEQFLSRDSRFALSPPSLPPAVREPGLLVDARGHLRTLPWSHGLDAFFAATLVRRAGA